MESNKKYEVETSKEFPVAVNRLYEAWTKPQDLKQWWKPMNDSLADVTNELNEGGTVSYVFENSGLQITGKYSEVVENEKLVYSWDWKFPADAIKDASYNLTIQFKSTDNGSTLHVKQEDFKDEEGVLVHRQGWEKSLNDLQQYLSDPGSSQDQQSDTSTSEGDRTGGYNEAPEQIKVGGG